MCTVFKCLKTVVILAGILNHNLFSNSYHAILTLFSQSSHSLLTLFSHSSHILFKLFSNFSNTLLKLLPQLFFKELDFYPKCLKIICYTPCKIHFVFSVKIIKLDNIQFTLNPWYLLFKNECFINKYIIWIFKIF